LVGGTVTIVGACRGEVGDPKRPEKGEQGVGYDIRNIDLMK
jgi:hypothetical protein